MGLYGPLMKKGFRAAAWIAALCLSACAPRVVQMSPLEGPPGTTVSVALEYLVGWPRVEIGDKVMDWPQLKLLATDPARQDVPGEELIWIEDKVLQFQIPELPK